MIQQAQHFEAQITRTVALDYLLYLPDGYHSKTDQQFPLILFLHGMGERGSDLNRVKLHGIPRNLEAGQELPFVVVSPQCPADSHWTLEVEKLNALLTDVIARYRIDQNRVYLTGMSMGGAGTWLLAAAYPQHFAAIAPVCARIVPMPVPRLAKLPIWVFHGDADEAVPVSNATYTVNALKALGADVQLTIYPDVGHDSWVQAYNDPALYEWFLSHARTAVSAS
jgi:predicted peptidase